MYPQVDAAPPIPYELITKHHLLYDLIYNPAETLFLKQGAAKGAAIKNGHVLKQLSALTTPNRAIAVLDIPPATDDTSLTGTVALALETIQDPGNLGTIIRIADWFGINRVYCSPDCVDTYNPKTIQATMGSFARVQVIEQDIVELLKTGHVPGYAATLHGRNITEFERIKEGILLIGNESRGLSQQVIDHSTHRITIPRLGGAESLNAAIATGIICGRLLI